MLKITREMLEREGACEKQVIRFARLFPDGAVVNKRNLNKALRAGLDLVWFIRRFVTGLAYVEYRQKWDALYVEYCQKWDALYAEYRQKWAALYAEYRPKWDALCIETILAWANSAGVTHAEDQ